MFSSDMFDKDYRHGYINAQIEVDIPLQIRRLRKQHGLTQPQLAELADMKQSRISKMERPGGANFSFETLRRLAKAFDVALIVRFGSFGDLKSWSDAFNPNTFAVPSFTEEATCKATKKARVRTHNKPRRLHRKVHLIKSYINADAMKMAEEQRAGVVPIDSYHSGSTSLPVEANRFGVPQQRQGIGKGHERSEQRSGTND